MSTLRQYDNGPVEGRWNDGKSAAAHPVAIFHRPHQSELRLCPAGSINDTQPLAVWPTGTVRVLSGTLSAHATIPLRLAQEPDDGQRLSVEDARALTTLAAWLRGPQKERRGRTRRRWFAGTLAVWAVCLTLYMASPVLFAFLARIIPQSWEESLGASARDSIVETLMYLPGVRGVDEEATDDPNLKRLLYRLEEGVPTQGYTFDLLVLDADFVNAFALPGGYMVLSTGLVKACESPDELAGVLAHEMAHVTGRHGTGRMLREQVWAFFLRLAGGGSDLTAALAKSLVTSSFDRDDERDADAKGVERLVGCGINPMGLADFFARLEKEEETEKKGTGRGLMSYVASHPELGERRENMERAAREGAPGATPAMTPQQWRAFRTACGITTEIIDETQKTPPLLLPAPPQRNAPAPEPDAPPPPSHGTPVETGLESTAWSVPAGDRHAATAA